MSTGFPRSIVRILLKHGATAGDCAKREHVLYMVVGWSDKRAMKRLIRHIVHTELLNIRIAECDRQVIQSSDSYRRCYQRCSKEFQDMKEAKFYNAVSLYDIFIGSEKVISGYARNEEPAEALEKSDYKTRFPIYFSSLKKEFDDKVQKQKLRMAVEKELESIFLNDLPRTVIQKVVSYLRDQDLKALGLWVHILYSSGRPCDQLLFM